MGKDKKFGLIRRSEKAFTLIELIVVLAIVAILATTMFVMIHGFIAEARDAKRKSDLTTIAKALTFFYLDHGYHLPSYNAGTAVSTCAITSEPSGSCTAVQDELKEYINGVPYDPQDSDKINYWYQTTDVVHSNYCLCANLEGSLKGTFKPPQCSTLTQNYCISGAAD